MTGVSDPGQGHADVSASHKPLAGPPKAMLVPTREVPKQATMDQEFTVPEQLSNCVMVSDTRCCIGRRPSGTSLTCVVPESWVAMSSCHGIIWWEGADLGSTQAQKTHLSTSDRVCKPVSLPSVHIVASNINRTFY